MDNRQIKDAMDTFRGVFKEHKVPGLTAIKLVRQTKATIGFTRFPISAVIGLDGIQWKPKGNLWPRAAVEKEIIKAFTRDGIDFTLHWGKNAAWDFPRLIDTMYGTKDDEWINQRSRLLSYDMADMFSNDFLRRIGLAGYNRNIDIIA